MHRNLVGTWNPSYIEVSTKLSDSTDFYSYLLDPTGILQILQGPSVAIMSLSSLQYGAVKNFDRIDLLLVPDNGPAVENDRVVVAGDGDT